MRYEYECGGCSERQEVRHRAGSEPGVCRACGAEQLRRRYVVPGLVFRGAGLPHTDDRPATR